MLQPRARIAEPAFDAALARHVAEGLAAPQKRLSSAWFYDDEGSRLFQRIMDLPEYYLTRCEHEVLQTQGAALARWIAPAGPERAIDLVELGAGDGLKTLTLCRALAARGAHGTFHPVDLSPHALGVLEQRFAHQAPGWPVESLCADYHQAWPRCTPGRRQVALLLGSNLGNLEHGDALALLCRVRSHLQVGDGALLGLDLAKHPRVVLAAYDDSQGVTARFNLNLLARLNRELGMDFALDRFGHYASYSPLDAAARSFLVSRTAQTVHSAVLGERFHFAAGETIYTEQSQKYTPASIAALAAASGFEVDLSLEDARGWYSVTGWRAV